MKTLTIDPAAAQPDALLGAIVCEEVKGNGRRLFHKGQRLTLADLPKLQLVDHPVHAVRLDPGDIHEDEAGLRLARAIAGAGVTCEGPVQSRVNLLATRKGLLRVDAEAVTALNLLESVAIFTLVDRLAVVPGQLVAGAKIAPVAAAAAILDEAEAIASRAPVLQVKPFQPLTAGVITTERLPAKLQHRFEETIHRKLGWYGARVLRFEECDSDDAAVEHVIKRLIDDGADLIMSGGGNTIDPLNPVLRALPQLNATMVKFGAPVDPGSMFWLAYAGDVPIFNLASCTMYAKSGIADLLLPIVMAGERITARDMAALGYGGLLGREMDWRFPAYDVDDTNENETADPAD